jgi:hypothetical protein
MFLLSVVRVFNAIDVTAVASGIFILGFGHDSFSYSGANIIASCLALFALSIFFLGGRASDIKARASYS